MSKPDFPKDFFWGASTASHQVEGGNHNQWTVWELGHAAELARTAPERLDWLPIWEEIKSQATDPENYVSGAGVDHYRRFREDFDLLKELNFNSLRFSIEWSRIQPTEGEWNQAAIEHYRTYIAELRQRGIEPFLNLWHWTSPIWFEEKGGFAKAANLKYFYDFAQKVAEELCDDINYVVLINEANNYAWYSYLEGTWPPGEKSVTKMIWVLRNLAKAHRGAYARMKAVKPSLQISSAPQMVSNVPKNPRNPWHRFGAWTANIGNNWAWMWLLRRKFDFIGFNNYFKNYVTGPGVSGIKNPPEPLNDMGWYMEPTAVAEIARKIHEKYPNKKIMIIENGVADYKDQHREWWIEETLKAMHGLRRDGIPLVGYFHWSLLDNFEWAFGWWPKFGLIAVDRQKGMKRTIRPSAKKFATYLAKSNK